MLLFPKNFSELVPRNTLEVLVRCKEVCAASGASLSLCVPRTYALPYASSHVMMCYQTWSNTNYNYQSISGVLQFILFYLY